MREPETAALLTAWSAGDRAAGERAMWRLYPQLRRLAAARLRELRSEVTLQPTDLAHEAYLRLVAQRSVRWVDRAHFFALSARLMRRILSNHFRERRRQKRGGGQRPVELADDQPGASPAPLDHLQLGRALEQLARVDAEAATIVELRYFAGLSVTEVAAVLRVSESTVARQWHAARLWLKARLASPERVAASGAQPTTRQPPIPASATATTAG